MLLSTLGRHNKLLEKKVNKIAATIATIEF